jgi:PKHD-type hydroxylase
MLIAIPAVLDRSRLARVRELIADAPFVDGRLSAGAAARQVKRNQEVEGGAAQVEALNQLVMGDLVRHPLYRSAALPLRVATPFYARYGPGMAYGEHVDDPVMGPPGGQYRSDVSVTVFLSDLEDYDGGELVMRTGWGEQRVRLPAGDAVLYPSSTLHQVTEVTRGERLVAVTWVQSLVRDPACRELLHTLNQAREKLLAERAESAEARQVDQAYVNLVRMWSDV